MTDKNYIRHPVTEMEKTLEVQNPADTQTLSLLGRALSVPIRIRILQLLNKKNMLLSQIANELDIPLSSCASHIQALIDANLVSVEYSTSGKGSLKWYTYSKYRDIFLIMRPSTGDGLQNKAVSYEINIGDFIDAVLSDECGMASDSELLMLDNLSQLYMPNRKDAQIIWSRFYGYLTYAIPNEYAFADGLENISVSLEICAECLGFNHDFKSDITFYINGIELCDYTCMGDFGNRYGKFTPSWWYTESTKYGVLVNIDVNKNGVYINGELKNPNVTLKCLNLSQGMRTLFKLEVKKNAKHCGGFNIFGKNFGDYNQDIIFRASYTKSEDT